MIEQSFWDVCLFAGGWYTSKANHFTWHWQVRVLFSSISSISLMVLFDWFWWKDVFFFWLGWLISVGRSLLPTSLIRAQGSVDAGLCPKSKWLLYFLFVLFNRIMGFGFWRWYTYLNSDFKRGGWSPEEDTLLCEVLHLFFFFCYYIEFVSHLVCVCVLVLYRHKECLGTDGLR